MKTRLPLPSDPQMAYDAKLAQRVRDALRATPGVTERSMFGGLAFLVGGRMCCGIIAEHLMVRVASDEFEAALREPYVRPMDFTGKPLRGFVYVSPPAIRAGRSLRAWVDRGIRFLRQESPSSRSKR
jgi:TfoX/Sxy family transcriptional regulator of competence genes